MGAFIGCTALGAMLLWKSQWIADEVRAYRITQLPGVGPVIRAMYSPTILRAIGVGFLVIGLISLAFVLRAP